VADPAQSKSLLSLAVLLFLGGWAVILLAVKNLRGCKWK